MTDKLKPCPFCGSEALKVDTGYYGAKWVECQECFIDGPSITANPIGSREIKDQEAIDAWNSRVEHKEPPENYDKGMIYFSKGAPKEAREAAKEAFKSVFSRKGEE